MFSYPFIHPKFNSSLFSILYYTFLLNHGPLSPTQTFLISLHHHDSFVFSVNFSKLLHEQYLVVRYLFIVLCFFIKSLHFHLTNKIVLKALISLRKIFIKHTLLAIAIDNLIFIIIIFIMTLIIIIIIININKYNINSAKTIIILINIISKVILIII